jgi:hypothetical protein
MMNAAAEPHFHRSEAFAEDVLDLVAAAPEFEVPAAPVSWLVNALPVVVALIGVAFAVLPPLG